MGQRPDRFELYLGGGRLKSYASDQFSAWYQLLRSRYRDFRLNFDPAAIPEDSPGDHSSWTVFIEQRLAANRDLMLVTNMRLSQRLKLLAPRTTALSPL